MRSAVAILAFATMSCEGKRGIEMALSPGEVQLSETPSMAAAGKATRRHSRHPAGKNEKRRMELEARLKLYEEKRLALGKIPFDCGNDISIQTERIGTIDHLIRVEADPFTIAKLEDERKDIIELLKRMKEEGEKLEPKIRALKECEAGLARTLSELETLQSRGKQIEIPVRKRSSTR